MNKADGWLILPMKTNPVFTKKKNILVLIGNERFRAFGNFSPAYVGFKLKLILPKRFSGWAVLN
ncbi:hypothetical protein [Pedobacter zeae]|uniref:Uncharacterized protein n=1 Tax=Pedobacter zeae TaxID=1737356 RepID=A0A7W6KEG6_9SPHI|nr:hypothetical protein [Pedobacter zeae]MBB4110336.1 hypothetical protein [Pedobacter zeae]GGH17364.1 hypothetical protein GCM10007422_40770 [Pedobacter zeae]